MWFRSMNKLETSGCEADHDASLMMTSPKWRRTQLNSPGTPMCREDTGGLRSHGPSHGSGVTLGAYREARACAQEASL